MAIKRSLISILCASWTLSAIAACASETLPPPTVPQPTLLTQFAERGDIDGVLDMIAHHADVNQVDDPMESPLAAAAGSGNVEIVKILLENGADANDHGRKVGALAEALPTPNRTVAVVDLLLAHGADPNTKVTHDPALLFAEDQRDVVIAGHLINAGADVNARSQEWSRETALCRAISCTPEVVASLLAHGAHVNATNASGETPLMYAVRDGRQEVIRLLIAHGAKVDVKDTSGLTALDIANNGIHPRTLALLEQLTGHKPKRKTSVDWIGQYPGSGPFHYGKQDLLTIAARDGDVEAMESLVALGAKVNSADDFDGQPLFEALKAGQLESVKCLVDHHANPNLGAPDAEGEPTYLPVEELTGSDDPAMWQALMSHGVKVDGIAGGVLLDRPDSPLGKFLTSKGHKPKLPSGEGVIFSPVSDDPAVLRRMLDLGMDPNRYGPIPPLLHIASLSANVECLQILLDHGADPTVQDPDGKTALDYVNDGHHPIATKLLTDAVAKWTAEHPN